MSEKGCISASAYLKLSQPGDLSEASSYHPGINSEAEAGLQCASAQE